MSSIQLIQISVEELTEIITKEMSKTCEVFAEKSNNKKEVQLRPFLTRKETAEFFGISLVCLHSWINKNRIKPYKIEGKIFFKYDELVKLLD